MVTRHLYEAVGASEKRRAQWSLGVPDPCLSSRRSIISRAFSVLGMRKGNARQVLEVRKCWQCLE